MNQSNIILSSVPTAVNTSSQFVFH